jgi:hypothetical protein
LRHQAVHHEGHLRVLLADAHHQGLPHAAPEKAAPHPRRPLARQQDTPRLKILHAAGEPLEVILAGDGQGDVGLAIRGGTGPPRHLDLLRGQRQQGFGLHPDNRRHLFGPHRRHAHPVEHNPRRLQRDHGCRVLLRRPIRPAGAARKAALGREVGPGPLGGRQAPRPQNFHLPVPLAHLDGLEPRIVLRHGDHGRHCFRPFTHQ